MGHNWRMPTIKGRRAIRHVVFDANYWKSFIYARLDVAMGDPGGLSLFGDRAELHRLFIEHLLSEYRVKTEGRGRVVDEWKQRPERSDNHWWDGIVGCAVAASMLGAALPGMQSMPAKRRTVTHTFAEWAALGNGSYLDAGDAEGLGAALREALRPPVRVLDAGGAPVARGFLDGPALSLPAGSYTIEVLSSPPVG